MTAEMISVKVKAREYGMDWSDIVEVTKKILEIRSYMCKKKNGDEDVYLDVERTFI